MEAHISKRFGGRLVELFTALNIEMRKHMHILVDCSLSSDLRWEREIALATDATEIVWDLDLGVISLTDEMTFMSFTDCSKRICKKTLASF